MTTSTRSVGEQPPGRPVPGYLRKPESQAKLHTPIAASNIGPGSKPAWPSPLFGVLEAAAPVEVDAVAVDATVAVGLAVLVVVLVEAGHPESSVFELQLLDLARKREKKGESALCRGKKSKKYRLTVYIC
jgi:hypothetical protein